MTWSGSSPQEHYVVVDDKLRLLAAIKNIWGERVTTVWVKQGHYASEPGILAQLFRRRPPPEPYRRPAAP